MLIMLSAITENFTPDELEQLLRLVAEGDREFLARLYDRTPTVWRMSFPVAMSGKGMGTL